MHKPQNVDKELQQRITTMYEHQNQTNHSTYIIIFRETLPNVITQGAQYMQQWFHQFQSLYDQSIKKNHLKKSQQESISKSRLTFMQRFG
jgi:hypothetical protein